MENIQLYLELRFIKCDVTVHLIICSYGTKEVLLFPFHIASGNICCYPDASVLPYSMLLKLMEMYTQALVLLLNSLMCENLNGKG